MQPKTLHKLHQEQGKTIVLITHSPELAEETERVIIIKDGQSIGNAMTSSVTELNYLGIAICGAKKKVNKLTESMALLR